MSKKILVFTDLDGTLLDSDYSYKKAIPALSLLKKHNIPLVISSSKTRTEIERIRLKLKNEHPFISENGGGIFIPENYFRFKIPGFKYQTAEDENYITVRLGADYKDLRLALENLRKKGFDVNGFGDMSVKQVSELTGLKTSDARLSKQRDFDEPFVYGGSRTSEARMKRNIRLMGFRYTQGEFFHIMGNSDKGRAVEILKKLYERQFGKIVTLALGDSPNDIEMLQKADYPVVVQKKNGSYDKRIKMKNLIKSGKIGPEGWNNSVMKLLEALL